MSFHTGSFLFVFLPLCFLGQFLVGTSWRNGFLLAASLLFYAWAEPLYVFFLIALIFVNYYWAKRVDREAGKARKYEFIFILALNLFLFFYFKFYNVWLDFLFQPAGILESMGLICAGQSVAYQVPPMPLGISFFMFSLLAYQVDVFRRTCEAEKSLLLFSLYISFFPKLVMGPITRYQDWKEQLQHHPLNPTLFHQGAKRFIIGLSQKLILSNLMLDIFTQAGQLDLLVYGGDLAMAKGWLMTLAYGFQLYFDFEGYSQMAIGLSNMLGFNLAENFDTPYMSGSIREFWRRWHMTLGQWFRDYIYIPLGGSHTTSIKKVRNIMIVWLCTGLWHGVGLNYVAWGLFHGVWILLEQSVLKKFYEKCPRGILILLTFFLVQVGWVFFYSVNLQDALAILSDMLNITQFNGALWLHLLKFTGLSFALCAFFASDFPHRLIHKAEEKYPSILVMAEPIYLTILFLISMTFLVSSSYTSFLYMAF